MLGIFRQPRIFISATSVDLAAARATAKEALERTHCIPVEMSTFEPDHQTIERKLRTIIRSCDAMVHIVGYRYGAEPPAASRPPDAARRSFTQMEYDTARRLGVPCYVMLVSPDYPVPSTLQPESAELQSLQKSHRDGIIREGTSFETIDSDQVLGKKCRELPVTRRLYERRLKRASAALSATAATAFLVWASDDVARIGCKIPLVSGLCASNRWGGLRSPEDEARDNEVRQRYASAADCNALKQFFREFPAHPLAEAARRRFDPPRFRTETTWRHINLPAPFSSRELQGLTVNDFAAGLCRRRSPAPNWELMSTSAEAGRELPGLQMYSATCRYRYPVQEPIEDCSP